MKNLTSFPEDFSPLIIVSGDRREIPPKSKGDILVYSVSNADFMYINLLNLGNALVVSDKQFVIEPADVLRDRFGSTNMLVIGSPAVNLLARQINSNCMFRFSISKETEKELKEQDDFVNKFLKSEFEDDLSTYYQCLEGILDVDSILARSVDLAPDIESLRDKASQILSAFKRTKICQDKEPHRRPIRNLMHKLSRPGIYDSLAGINHGEDPSRTRDYGLITVLPNPFSETEKYHIIYVAGVHAPGTALGLKLLSDKNSFKGHPFGGVYEVKINEFVGHFEKFQKSVVRWETRAYKKEKYENIRISGSKKIRVFLSSPAGKSDQKQREFNDGLKKILKTTFEEKGLSLQVDGPYTLPLGPGIDFWKNILDYTEGCEFVLHDMTRCARGVMVEIGFSVGKRRQYFLIWNSQKSPVKNWSAMKIPSLLPAANIEQLDLSDSNSAFSTIQIKIVNRALACSSTNKHECYSCRGLSKKDFRNSAYIYSNEMLLKEHLFGQIRQRGLSLVAEENSDEEARLCRICQVLRVSDYAFVDIAESDLNSFIVLGMAKAIGTNTLPLSLKKYGKADLPWAKEIEAYNIDFLGRSLDAAIAKFLT